MADFTFLGSKITADGDCSHEIKRHLLLGRKAMTKLDKVSKNKDHGIWSHHFMANRWENNGKNNRLYFLAPWKKSYDKLESVLKSRDIILLTKVHIVKLWLFQLSCVDVRVGP